MFKEVETALIEVLKNAGINAQSWSGDKTELFRLPRTLPSVRLVLEKASFKPSSIFTYEVTLTYTFLVFFRSLRDDGTGAYSIIETILNLLTSEDIYSFTPSELKLLYHENGEFCYALAGNCSYLYVPPDEEEPLVQRITTYEGKDGKAQLVSDVIKKEDQEG